MSEPLTYLDYAATAPLRPEVAEAMAAVLAEPLGNPTGSHPAAQRARRLLEEARDDVADVPRPPAGGHRVHLGWHRIGQPGRARTA